MNHQLYLHMVEIVLFVYITGGVGKSAITNRFVMGRWIAKVCLISC